MIIEKINNPIYNLKLTQQELEVIYILLGNTSCPEKTKYGPICERMWNEMYNQKCCDIVDIEEHTSGNLKWII